MQPDSLQKRIVFSALLILGSLLLLCVLAEVLLRTFRPQADLMYWFDSDERYGIIHKKNYSTEFVFSNSGFAMDVKTNSLGLRDREYDFTDDTVTRVLLIGDSFTFGYGLNVESLFDIKLEKLLNGRLGGYIVINAGFSNWGTLQETMYARDHFDLFRPDIIVLTFCGNDNGEDRKFLQEAKTNFKGDYFFPGKRFIKRHSHFYRYLREKWWVLSAMRTRSRETEESDEPGERNAKPPRSVYVDKQTSSAYTESDWERTLSLIREFHEDYMTFNPRGLLLVQATAPWDDHIRAKLKSLENGRNLIYVDLYERTAALPAEKRRLSYDPHWNERMHGISAEAIFAVIAERAGDGSG